MKISEQVSMRRIHGSAHQSGDCSARHAQTPVEVLLGSVMRLADAVGALVTRSTEIMVSKGLNRTVEVAVASWLKKGRRESSSASIHCISIRNYEPLIIMTVPVANRGSGLSAALMLRLVLHMDTQLGHCSQGQIEGLAAGIGDLIDCSDGTVVRSSCCDDAVVPVCCVCDQIEGEFGAWRPWQAYLTERVGRMLSHTYCPSCFRDHTAREA